MQAAATLKQRAGGRTVERPRLMTAVLSWLTRIFGCWHTEMSRPFTLRSESYRVCLECGAHRHFNPQTWELTGPYYYAPATALDYSSAAIKAAPARSASRPALCRAA